MNSSYINHLQPPYHYQEEEENRDNYRSKDAQFAPINAHNPNQCPGSASNSTHMGFDFASSPKQQRAKKRKAEAIEFVNGGRIIRPTDKKDRHSKVCTARGQRDRRLRLSPRTAIQFYDVQDRLGFDRPSKAIDWLINEAQAAIDALDQQRPPSNQFSINSNAVDADPVSGFSFLLQGPDFSPSRNRGEAEEGLFCPGFQQGVCANNSLQIFDTSWEMDRLQKLVTWNCENGNRGREERGGGAECSYVEIQGQPILGYSQMSTSQRETLQSSIVNYSPIISNHFPGFSFSNELSSITAAATTVRDDTKNERPSSIPHYGD